MEEQPFSITGIVIRKDANSKSDGILELLSKSLDESVTGFCVENNSGFFLVFECASIDFANVLRSIYNIFRRNTASRLIFNIDDVNKKLFSEFQILVEESDEDQRAEENSGDSEIDVRDVAFDIYSRVKSISENIVGSTLKDIKASKSSLFLSHEDIILISKIDGLFGIREMLEFTSESACTKLPSDSSWPAFPPTS